MVEIINILEDTFETFICAMYLDTNNYEIVEFVLILLKNI